MEHVTTAGAAIALLETGRAVELSLDHDLGDDDRAGKGVHVVDRIAESQMIEGRDLWPRDGITIHSANPAGVRQMAQAIERYAGALHRVHRTMTSSGRPRFEFDADRDSRAVADATQTRGVTAEDLRGSNSQRSESSRSQRG
jgi:hypothetical protein